MLSFKELHNLIVQCPNYALMMSYAEERGIEFDTVSPVSSPTLLAATDPRALDVDVNAVDKGSAFASQQTKDDVGQKGKEHGESELRSSFSLPTSAQESSNGVNDKPHEAKSSGGALTRRLSGFSFDASNNSNPNADSKQQQFTSGARGKRRSFAFGDYSSLDNKGDDGMALFLPLGSETAAPSTTASSETDFYEYDGIRFDNASHHDGLTKKIFRRKSSLSVQLRDEAEEADEPEPNEAIDSDDGTFAFGDFVIDSVSEDLSIAETSASYTNAFAFGDFVVPVEDDVPARKNQSSATPKNEKRSATGLGGSTMSPGRAGGVTSVLRNYTLESGPPHPKALRGLCFGSMQEDRVLTAGGESYLSLNTLVSEPRRQLLCLYLGHEKMVLHVTTSIDFKYVATSGADGLLMVFDVQTGKCLIAAKHPDAVTCSSFAMNARYIVSGCRDGCCRLWHSKRQQNTEIASFCDSQTLVTSIAFQPGGELVASAYLDKRVIVWSASTLKVQFRITEHEEVVGSVCFPIGSGKTLLSVSASKVILTDTPTGAAMCTLTPEAIDNPLFPREEQRHGMKFTAACFAPPRLPSHMYIATSMGTVALYRMIKKQQQAASPDAATQPSPEASVSLGACLVCEYLLKGAAIVMQTGPAKSILLGDKVGNTYVLRTEPTTNNDPVQAATPAGAK